jgi:threonine/homoserine/homoserine lactone efflux protein
MITTSAALGVALVALGLVVTPGPNMVYLASRSISQGRGAGLVSLAGVGVGFGCYLIATAVGLGALFRAVPVTYDVVKLAGAAYLAFLAIQMARPGGRSPFEVRPLAPRSRTRLFAMGLLTSLLNPKIALLYGALIPQFVRPHGEPVWLQFLELGAVQITVSISVNALIVLAAARIARFLHGRPRAMTVQRMLAGTVLGGFALRIATSAARP